MEVKELLEKKDVRTLIKVLFKEEITETQCDIIKTIAFAEKKRVIICSYTRYGKTYSVALGVLLYFLFNKNKKINLIAPIQDQTGIIRNYISEFITRCSILSDLLETDSGGADRIKKEVSKKRMTFKNGCELRILSASGEAERLMGWGGDVIILDECCLIDYKVYRQKITRMLGDNKDSMLISIGNPWNKTNQFFAQWNDDSFYKIHVPYEIGIKEKRISKEFIEEQRQILTKPEFQILYEAVFPTEDVNAVFSFCEIENSFKRNLDDTDGVNVLGVDVARFGSDFTVFTVMRYSKTNGTVIIKEQIKTEKENLMSTSGRVVDLNKVYNFSKIVIDDTGLGGGVTDRVSELIEKEIVIPLQFGGSPSVEGNDRFGNIKAELFFILKNLFVTGKIQIKKGDYTRNLINELMAMRYEFTSNGKIKVIDPTDSPDFADSLAAAIAAIVVKSYNITILDDKDGLIFG